MDKKVEKFKEDYKDIKSRVKLIKKELRDLRKEAKSVAKAANSLYARGEDTMYMEDESPSGNKVCTPKFNGLGDMMDDIESFTWIDINIQRAIDDMP